MATNSYWQLVHGTRLHWKSWDGEHVVFHEQAGDTHLLTAFAASTLKRLERGPADFDDLLATAHSDAVAVAGGNAVTQDLKDLLAKFSRLGMLEEIRQ